MSNSKRITLTVLGGGSNFVPGFINTMCRKPAIFTDAHVRLQDLAPERVELIRRFCEKYASAKGVPITFVNEPDLDASLDGADFVITNFRIGGIGALVLDETIPSRLGSFGEETTGAGALLMTAESKVPANTGKRCRPRWMSSMRRWPTALREPGETSGILRLVL